MQTEKLAPAKMHYFIVELLNDLAVRGKVLSVLVEESAYLVMLSLADRGIAFRRLSPYDVSRSLRGDPDALALVRADLLRDVSAEAAGRLTPPVGRLTPPVVTPLPTRLRRS